MGNNRPNANICTMTCSGDSSQTCGGPDAINIYVKDSYAYTTGPASVLPSYNGYDVTQCWQDASNNRILKQGPATSIPYDQMTAQKCVDGCAAAGFSSAGVEYGGECYCDNVTLPPGQSESISENRGGGIVAIVRGKRRRRTGGILIAIFDVDADCVGSSANLSRITST
ncbi:9658_t:CDS:2, partial [Acaulospora colombiana]